MGKVGKLGFLDKRDKVDMVEWASGMRELVLDYLSHLQNAKVGEVYTFSHGYRTFTSHLVQHLPSYCEEWNDVFEWWCFVYERFAGVLTKKLRCFNKNTRVDVHLGSCLSMEAAIWRHLSMEDIELDREVMADASAIDCAGHTGSFQERDTLGLGGGASVELHGRAVQLWNLFTVDGVTYAGGRTQKEVLALPGYRQLIRPGGKGKNTTNRLDFQIGVRIDNPISFWISYLKSRKRANVIWIPISKDLKKITP